MADNGRMARHEVGLQIDQDIPLGSKDVTFVVRENGEILGRVRISRGSIDWLTSPKSKKGRRVYWAQFAKLMEDNGHLI